MALVIERNRKRNKIIREIDTMNNSDKLYLLSYIANKLAKPKVKTSYNLTDLRGLGKGLWEKEGIDNYISNERNSWN